MVKTIGNALFSVFVANIFTSLSFITLASKLAGSMYFEVPGSLYLKRL